MANLDSGSSNLNIDGNTTVFTDFGGADTYTLLPSLSANVTITDNDASIINLPTGLNVTAALFLADGVQFTVNGFTVTFIGKPALFTYKFGGTPLDPTAGTDQTFAQTAVAFGTTVPAAGAPANPGTTTGSVNADGTVAGGGGGGQTPEEAYTAAKVDADAAAAAASASATAATAAQAEADAKEAAVTDLATAQAYKAAADAAKAAADKALADAQASATAAQAAVDAAAATTGTADDTEAAGLKTTADASVTSATTAQATATAEVTSANAAVAANQPGTTASFNIEFDYRFDTIDFFTTEARAALEEAARIWEGVIKDEFPNFSAGQTVTIRNPQTNADVTLTTDKEIDDLLIFVGAGTFGGTVLADAGPDGFNAAGDINQLRIASDFRGQGPTTDFEPFIGTMRFNSQTEWDFSLTTPSTTRQDFLSTVLHEMGHILGFSTSQTFQAFITGDQFGGPNATAANNGQSVPMESATNFHVLEGFRNDMVLMDPASIAGQRVLPSDIDKALLADIGYEIDGFTKQGTSFAIATNGGETIFGRDVADIINGLAGNDQIQGGGGNDSLRGGPGDDSIFGDAGMDFFYIGVGDQQITINDFNASNERIVIDPAFGFASEQDVINTLTRPFTNASQLTLDGGTTVLILDNANTSPGSPITVANIDFGVLGPAAGTAARLASLNASDDFIPATPLDPVGSLSMDSLFSGSEFSIA